MLISIESDDNSILRDPNVEVWRSHIEPKMESEKGDSGDDKDIPDEFHYKFDPIYSFN